MTPSIALMTYDPQGDWRGISRHFVQSRTPTQVASHAQKYFIRQNNMNKRKRRSSLFDIVNEAPEEPAKAGGRVDGVAGGAGGASGIPGGLSMAFASRLGGYNPTGVAPPATFSAHGANPPGVAAASATRGDKSASTSDIGTAGEAAAAYAGRDVAGILAGLMRAADFSAEEDASGGVGGTNPRRREGAGLLRGDGRLDLFLFFASDLALCLWVHVSQSWRITSEKEAYFFWLPLFGFAFRPLLGCLIGFAPSSSSSPPFVLSCASYPMSGGQWRLQMF